MANLTLKKIPDALREELQRDAQQERRSLNAHIIQLLELSAAERARRRKMRAGRRDLEKFVASLPVTRDSTECIREDRRRR